MSDQTTKDILQAYFNAFNASDYAAMAALLHDDVAHDINQGEREIGLEKFRWFLGMMAQHYDETISDLVIMVADGGVRAAAEFTISGTYLVTAPGLPAADKQKYSLPVGQFFEVDEGKITRVTTYYNLKDWMAQVS